MRSTEKRFIRAVKRTIGSNVVQPEQVECWSFSSQPVQPWSVHNARVWRNNHDAYNTGPCCANEMQECSMSVAASEKMVAPGAGPLLVRCVPCTKDSSSRVGWTPWADHSRSRGTLRRWCKGVS
eukprot:5012558-Pleurochrysis_carterae.AAC.2